MQPTPPTIENNPLPHKTTISSLPQFPFKPKHSPPPPPPTSISKSIHTSHLPCSPHSLSISILLIPHSMTDRIHPNTAATKPHQRNAAGTRPLYRPQLHGRGRQKRRSCCCSLFLFLTLIIISLVILISIISAGFYFLYRPHRPSFSVTALKLSHFKISSSPSSSKLDSKFDLNITATNPNKKLSFIYDPISISVLSDGIDVGDGSFSGFVHGKNSVTVIKVGVSSGREIESGDIEKLKSDMKSKISGMGLEIKLDTKVKMKIGRLKSPRIGIRVSCKGITVNVPTGKKEATALTSNAKCKVDVRIKIWKWIV